MKNRIDLRLIAAFAAIATCPVAIVTTGTSARGQVLHAAGPLPSYEVATIKPSPPTPRGLQIPPPNVFRNFGATARGLVRVAYGLPPGAEGRVLGGPNWIDNNRYDVDVEMPDDLFATIQKMPPKERSNQMLLMVQSLLADRFKLKVHFETREMPIYELVVAKGGPKLTPAKELPSEPDTPPRSPGPGGPPRPQDMRQGFLVQRKSASVSEMTAKGQTLDILTMTPFFGLAGSPVVNETGLSDKYDFVLDWAPDQPATPGSDTLAAEPDAPPLFTALEEQLGLQLIKTKGPVEVIVIDSIELPSAN